jgi:pimeloyl-ACP methyl ester carboxylesterase
MSAIVLNQEIVHYEVLGRGRPLILLHGWVGSWRYWIPVMQAASVSFRAYGIDLWGFGDSGKNQEFYSLEQQCNLLDGFLEQMGIGRVALIGHGLGGVLAQMYAQRAPGVVDRIMAVSCPLDERMVSSRLRTSTPVDLADWLLGKSSLMEPARADAPKTDMQALETSFTGLSAINLIDAWAQIQTSCLLVNGLNDPAVFPPDLEQLAALPETVHAVSFDQSGHFPMLDESSKFNRLVTDFLALPSGESPRTLQLKEEWKRRVR